MKGVSEKEIIELAEGYLTLSKEMEIHGIYGLEHMTNKVDEIACNVILTKALEEEVK